MMGRVRSVLVGLVGLFSSAVACRQVAGIEPGIPIECVTTQDCAEKAPACQVATACEQGVCVFEAVAEGMPTAEQTPGDCSQAECVITQDCAEKASVCQVATACEQGACVFEAVAEGTPTAEQTPGDCLQAVCNGAGKVKMVFLTEMVCKTGLLGICAEGLQRCNEHGQPEGACIAQEPKVEQCDPLGLDEDCDGLVNEEGLNCVCGDGYLSKGEACDDGGTVGGDKCSVTCQEEKVLQVVAGAYHTCALLNGGSVKCWGDNYRGQLGLGDRFFRGNGPGEMGESLPAVDLGTGKTATAIDASGGHTCARLNGGSVKCWGYNVYGQLGLGDTNHRGDGMGEMGENLPAVDLGTGKTATAITGGNYNTCALLNDGSVRYWGHNHLGQLGLGDTGDRGDNPDEMGDNLPTAKLYSATW